MIAVGAPFALPALLVMMGVFYALYKYFMASVRQAKRLEAVSRCVLEAVLVQCADIRGHCTCARVLFFAARDVGLLGQPSQPVLSIIAAHWAMCCRSPVLSSVNEAINGLATIRAFNIGPWLIARNRELVDKNAATSLLNQSLNRWLSVRLEGLGEQREGLPNEKKQRCPLHANIGDGKPSSSYVL